MIARRAMLRLLLGAFACVPRYVRAQPVRPRRPVIGYLSGLSPTVADPRILEGLRQGLRENGFREGETITVLYRWLEGRADTVDAVARALLAERPDVVITAGPQLIRALQQAAGATPIVMAVDADPVSDGFVDSLAHPGRNITGMSLQNAEMHPKRLQLLQEMVPNLTRVAELIDPTMIQQDSRTVAAALGLELETVEIAPDDLREKLRDHPGIRRAQAVLVGASPFFNFNRKLMIDAFAGLKLPASYEERVFARDGGLLSYGPSFPDMYRRSVGFAAKILAGAKPGDLPIELPTKFELVINLKTAKALGMAIPPSLLARADEVVE